jgi:hypothetical protein
MTTLTKPVYRRIEFERGKFLLNVGLHPNGMISFREYGSRRTYQYPIERVYFLAVEAARAERKKARAAARDLKRRK